MSETAESQPPRGEEGEATDDPIEAAAEIMADELHARLWLRAILPLIQSRSQDPDPSDRVQLAYDKMHIAACERVARILRSDLAGKDQA